MITKDPCAYKMLFLRQKQFGQHTSARPGRAATAPARPHDAPRAQDQLPQAAVLSRSAPPLSRQRRPLATKRVLSIRPVRPASDGYHTPCNNGSSCLGVVVLVPVLQGRTLVALSHGISFSHWFLICSRRSLRSRDQPSRSPSPPCAGWAGACRRPPNAAGQASAYPLEDRTLRGGRGYGDGCA